MKAYRFAWLAVVTLLAVVGIVAALVLSPAALVTLVGIAVMGTILTLLVLGGDGARSHSDRAGWLLRSGLVAGTVAGSLVGFASLLGPGVFPLALLLLVSSPYAAHAWSHLRRYRLTPSTGQTVPKDDALASTSLQFRPAPGLVEPALLNDEQLCQAWLASYWALRDASSWIQMMGAVAARQRFLDEFERRNRSGLAAWLASGPRAAGNPLPYLAESRVNGPAIDWDELTRGQDC
ncbi:hypothetical protein [Terrabacter sp. MAHUQ-38]|uniref:hypothetical protein n=1 Tax=unclassified Terrabacter TaxID=2630222 RepID=UPI00165E3911|nr:hypothetical protein [Terrabacter sp. MAHUQ-38]MBC9822920.1 hypothetical protein [Terrabacter sp. MAHUQ-38]